MRSRSERRHQITAHQQRRLKEDRNQHYDDLTCPCWTSPRAMARFKEQPQVCSLSCCGNPRRHFGGGTLQERRANEGSRLAAD